MDEDRTDRPADPPRVRAGHDERAAAMQALDGHLEAGRLDVAEYGTRSDRAAAAVYRDELDALFTDLPQPHATTPSTDVRRVDPQLPAHRGQRQLALVLPIMLGIGLVLLTVFGNPAGFMLFPLIFLLVGRFGPPRRHF
ncbi:DUF1707 SHOCT-like domain-containing protein [Actinomycetospora atypica]|uniref:DUF1707 domain-containing protein n=1 Tax=Actinomycetospora atypica TaxID=1290095 RepID=A0ABV9YPU4_9PSEU